MNKIQRTLQGSELRCGVPFLIANEAYVEAYYARPRKGEGGGVILVALDNDDRLHVST